MRLWSVAPQLLDRAALVACWRESLLAQAVLANRTRGYRSHPQLTRFRQGGIGQYLSDLALEASDRGYRFDAARILPEPQAPALTVTAGQLQYEYDWLIAKCRGRCWEWGVYLSTLDPIPHPMFTVVDGPIEPWERVKEPQAGVLV